MKFYDTFINSKKNLRRTFNEKCFFDLLNIIISMQVSFTSKLFKCSTVPATFTFYIWITSSFNSSYSLFVGQKFWICTIFLLLSDICQLEMMSILSTSIPSICASVHPIPSIHPLLSWRYRRPQSSHNWNQRFTDVSFRCSVSYRTHSIVSPFPFPFPSSLSFSDVVLVWLLVVLVCPIGNTRRSCCWYCWNVYC